jgi:carbamoyltransferase
MKILGIADSHDAGAAIIEDGIIIAAVNEERLNRIKLCWGFPHDAIKEVCRIAKIQPHDIDVIAIATKYSQFSSCAKDPEEAAQMLDAERNFIASTSKVLGPFFRTSIWKEMQKKILYLRGGERQSAIKKILKEQYGFTCPVEFVEHHLSHAASAYYTAGKDQALVITADAHGDALCGSVSIGNNGKMNRLMELGSYNSIARYYAYVTEICGFKPNRHEGKITGLAAYGQPIYADEFTKMIRYQNGKIVNKLNGKHHSAIKQIKERMPGWTRENISASIQVHLEKQMTAFVQYWVRKTNVRDVVCAGGLFANVKLNQRILELEEVNSIFVHPHMGDGGIGVGAALAVYAEKQGFNNIPTLRHAYLGPEFSDKDIKEEIEKMGLPSKKITNKDIGKLLADGKVVGIFKGRMEYGPRALGNRSIFYEPIDKSVNDWLNKNLNRTEFMPFAPTTLYEHAEEAYKNCEGGKHTATFMTITFDCTDKMKKECPAVCHIDDTARPQLVSKDINKNAYEIITEFKRRTGLHSVVNTSFNMHEEPIVCTPNDALRSFLQGKLDALVVGNFLVESKSRRRI